MAVLPPRPLVEADDRDAFDCGREALNGWFRRHAWFNHLHNASRVNVLADAATSKIAGYVTLSATQIERAYLPKAQQRNRPDPVPAFLLGQLGVDRAYQGQGHAVALLRFALLTALQAAETVGAVGVLTHPVDESVRSFYSRWGFQDLPFDPQRSMLVRMVDLRASRDPLAS